MECNPNPSDLPVQPAAPSGPVETNHGYLDVANCMHNNDPNSRDRDNYSSTEEVELKHSHEKEVDVDLASK